MIEIILGVVIPLRMFMSRAVLKSPLWLFVAASLVVFGVFINRLNNFIIAYHPPYSKAPYFPSIGEISVTVGLIALLIILYKAFVMIFPIISTPDKEHETELLTHSSH